MWVTEPVYEHECTFPFMGECGPEWIDHIWMCDICLKKYRYRGLRGNSWEEAELPTLKRKWWQK